LVQALAEFESRSTSQVEAIFEGRAPVRQAQSTDSLRFVAGRDDTLPVRSSQRDDPSSDCYRVRSASAEEEAAAAEQ